MPDAPGSPPKRTNDPPSTGAPTDWRSQHLWQFQPVRDVLAVAGVLAILYLGYVLSPVTVPMLVALALAYLFEPVVRWVTKRKWISRQGAAVGIIVGAGAVLLVPLTFGAGFAIIQGTNQVMVVARDAGKLKEGLEASATHDSVVRQGLPNQAWRQIYDVLRPPPSDDPPSELQPAINAVSSWAIANAEAIGAAVGKRAIGTGADAAMVAVRGIFSLGVFVFFAFITAFFFYFFCTGYGQVLAFWEGLIPERRKGRIIDMVGEMDRVIAGFVRGRLLICSILAVFMTIAYWLIGVPTPLILGPVVGMLFLVPYVHFVGVPLAMLLMWLQPGGAPFQEWWWIVGSPIALYMIAQFLDDYVLTPRIQGKATGMEAPSILFASIAGGVLAGVYGLLLAIPVAACIKILLREVFWPRFKAWSEGKEKDFLPVERG